MRRWLAFTLGLAMVTSAFWALATTQPIGWVHPEIDAASKDRLESVLRDTGEARILVP